MSRQDVSGVFYPCFTLEVGLKKIAKNRSQRREECHDKRRPERCDIESHIGAGNRSDDNTAKDSLKGFVGAGIGKLGLAYGFAYKVCACVGKCHSYQQP